MKIQTLEKLTKEQIKGFVLGTQESFERGDFIDPDKNLTWTVKEYDTHFFIKAEWIKSITRYPAVNPIYDKDDEYHYDDNNFKILKVDSIRKLCAEIYDMIDYVNSNELNKY